MNAVLRVVQVTALVGALIVLGLVVTYTALILKN